MNAAFPPRNLARLVFSMKTVIDDLFVGARGFLGSISMQLRVALSIGLPSDDELPSHDASMPAYSADREVNGSDHANRPLSLGYCTESPGYLTRSGLGSLEIGAGND